MGISAVHEANAAAMLDVAIDYARKNPIIKLPKMAAVIYYRRDLISFGYNSLKSHPFAAKYCRHPEAIYLHAEIAAIRKALSVLTLAELRASDLYVARVLKNGTPALAKPCSGCMRAIVEFGIQNVVWTEDQDAPV